MKICHQETGIICILIKSHQKTCEMIYIPFIILCLLVEIISFLLYLIGKKKLFKIIANYCLYINFYFILFFITSFLIFFLGKQLHIYTVSHGLETYVGLLIAFILLLLRKIILKTIDNYFLLLHAIFFIMISILIIFLLKYYKNI